MSASKMELLNILALKKETSRDPFFELGLEDDASIETVERAFRHLAAKWHSDKFHVASAEQKKLAGVEFEKISSAYDAIKEIFANKMVHERNLHKLPAVIDFIASENRNYIREQMRAMFYSQKTIKEFLKDSEIITVSSQTALMSNPMSSVNAAALNEDILRFQQRLTHTKKRTFEQFSLDHFREFEDFLCASLEAKKVNLPWLAKLAHLSDDNISSLMLSFNNAGLCLRDACITYADITNDDVDEFSNAIDILVGASIADSEYIDAIFLARPHCKKMSNGIIGLKHAGLLNSENLQRLISVGKDAACIGRGLEMIQEIFSGKDFAENRRHRFKISFKILTGHDVSYDEILSAEAKFLTFSSKEIADIEDVCIELPKRVTYILKRINNEYEIKNVDTVKMSNFIKDVKRLRLNRVNLENEFVNQRMFLRLLDIAPYSGALCCGFAELITLQDRTDILICDSSMIDKFFNLAPFMNLDDFDGGSSLYGINNLLFELRVHKLGDLNNILKVLEYGHFALYIKKSIKQQRQKNYADGVAGDLRQIEFDSIVQTLMMTVTEYPELQSTTHFKQFLCELCPEFLDRKRAPSLNNLISLCVCLVKKGWPIKDHVMNAFEMNNEEIQQYIDEITENLSDHHLSTIVRMRA